MIRPHSLFVCLILTTAAGALSLSALSDPPAPSILPPTPTSATQTKQTVLARDFGRLPLSFESNQGQANAQVRFLTHGGDNTLFLTPTEAVFALTTPALKRPAEKGSVSAGRKAHRGREKRTETALRMQMVGSDPKASALEQQALPGRINYLIGNNPRHWHTDVPTFGRVGFRGVYPGVDLVYYGNQRNLEYDFLVAPHADPKQIQLHFAEAQSVQVNKAGELVVRVPGREWTWRKPAVYQQDARGKHGVAGCFRLTRLPEGQTGVSFALGHYDTDRALVIDPVLVYSTYLGGSGTDAGNAIAVDITGNTYIAGSTSSSDFPIPGFAFQEQLSGSQNAFVTKLNPSGTALIYSTFMGGSGTNGDAANGIAVDSQGDTYITGLTSSSDFPVSPGAFQLTKRASADNDNAFVTKLNPTGDGQIYSTYLGGSDTDVGTSIVVDSQGNAYITGQADSHDFPVTAGAFQTTNQGSSGNAFVTKLNPTGAALIYSTFLGGSGLDYSNGIAVDSQGDAYVVGLAGSTDFPVSPGAFQLTKKGIGNNAFVTKFNATGTALLYSTYLGGSSKNGDQGSSIAVDSQGNAYVTGSAISTDFPITAGAFQTTNKGKTNAFITKFNPTGTSLIYSTYLGGSHGDGAQGIAIDSSGDAYVTGSASSTDFPITAGAFQTTDKGSGNAFITKLNPTGTALIYSTFLGGNNFDYGTSIAVDSQGNAYITGSASSTDFPITAGAFQTTNKGSGNAFITKLHAVPILPDFNNDGFTDLLIQNSTTNVIASWFMNGSTWISGAYFSLTPPSDYALVGVGDFSGNGATTLVLQSKTSNQIAFWYTSGANHATIPGGNFVNTTPPTGWKVVGVGDFNGDGKSDLVLQNQTSNQVAIWFMNGYLYSGGVLMPFTPPTGWTVAGVGDFNGDGFPDIAFQNQTSGQIALWYMNGPTYAGGIVLTTTPVSGWKIVGVGDYNGDGYADLLFQNQASNQAAVWYLKNGAFAGGATLSLTPPAGWKIVGPR